MVDHEILLTKVQICGINENCVAWFHSSLSERRQFVCIDGEESSKVLIQHGVSQGSILGTLLFILYISDIPLYVNSADVDLYTDVTTLVSSADINSTAQLRNALSNLLAVVENWACANRFPLNETKTKSILEY